MFTEVSVMNFSPLLRLSYFVLDFFYVFVIHIFYRAWLGRSRSRLRLYIIYAAFIAADCLIYFTQNSALIFSMSAYFLFVMCSLIYGRIHIRSFIGAGILVILSIISEMVSTILPIFIPNGEFSTIMMYVMCRILLYLLVLLLMRILRNRHIYHVTPKYSVGIIITPFVSAWTIIYVSYLLGYSIDYQNNYADIFALITYFLILLLNIASFYMFDRQFNNHRLEQKNSSVENVLKAQQSEQELNKEHEQNIRRIRHDLINYIIGVRAMIESGSYEKALESLDNKIDAIYSDGLYAHTGCRAIDSIINFKAAKAQKHNIRVVAKLMVRAVPPIKEEDVCVIIGNGMDNAIEYLASHSEVRQIIQIDLDYSPMGFVLGIQNYVGAPVELLEGGYVRSTKSGPGHGFGIESADMIAHRYAGEIIISCQNNIFVYGAVLHPGPWNPPE